MCAIVTSFIGVSFSLFEFLMDSFNITSNQKGRCLGLLLTFAPPLLFAFYYPNGFILALGYAGIFVAILLGILPALMAWSGRYWKKIATGYQPKIDRGMLTLIILFSLVIIYSQLASH
jgi:tyrosine-specific transport protein